MFSLILLLFVLGLIVYGFNAVMQPTSSATNSAKDKAASQTVKILKSFFRPSILDRKIDGSKFAKGRELKRVLNSRNEGLLIDGKSRRLSPEQSFAHCMVVAPTGAGKTTRYVIPNLLTLDNCSFVVTDPSGEIFNLVSGDLKRRGFEVLLLDPAHPHQSLCYNPLANISSFTQIMEISQTLVSSSNSLSGTGSSAFWYEGAADIISALVRCLGVAGDEYLNLANLLFLLQSFGKNGSGLAGFLTRYGDRSTIKQLNGILSGNEKTVAGFISTATNSLQMVNNPDLGRLMSRNDIDFRRLRRKKTALFLSVPSDKIQYYSFIMNLLYVDLFNSMTSELPRAIRARGEKCLPVYCMMDEFGHTSIPNFSTVANTIRKYDVSLSIILQNFAQLDVAYGKNDARNIIDGGMNSRIFYPGLPSGTADEVEKILGKEVINEIKLDGSTLRREQNLLNADRIRTLADDSAIFVTGNKEAMLIDTLASYKNPAFKRRLTLSAAESVTYGGLPEVKHVPM